MRYAIEEPELGWKQMPNRRALRFLHAGLSLPELANRVIRTADVYVRANNRKVVGVSRIELSEWKLNSKGAVDLDEAVRRTIYKFKGGYSSAARTPSPADVEAIIRCLGLASGKP